MARFTAEQLAHLLRSEADDPMTDHQARAGVQELVASGNMTDNGDGTFSMSEKGVHRAELILQGRMPSVVGGEEE